MRYENLVHFGRLESDVVSSVVEMSYIADDVYEILLRAYADVKGGLLFATPDELISKTAQWQIIYLDGVVVGAIIYKAKRGLKMVAMAISDSLNYSFRTHIKTMLSDIFKLTFANSWMELSEGAERFITRIGGQKYFVPHGLASRLTGKEILGYCDDGYHYHREINGVVKRKVIIGQPRLYKTDFVQ